MFYFIKYVKLIIGDNVKNKLFVLLTILFIPFIVNAESIKMDWYKNYGGNTGEDYTDYIKLEDESIIVSVASSAKDIDGMTNIGGKDAYLIRYDKDGNIMWQKNYGGSSTDKIIKLVPIDDQSFYAVAETSSSSFKADSYSKNSNGGKDIAVIKINYDGTTNWVKLYGGSKDETIYSATKAQDDAVVIVGSSKSTNISGVTNKGEADAFIIKISLGGYVEWQKGYGGTKEDKFLDVYPLENNSVVTVGQTKSSKIEGQSNKGNSNDIIIVRYDAHGEIIYQRSISSSDEEIYNSSIVYEDGSIIVAGYSNALTIDTEHNSGSIADDIVLNGSEDIIIVKYDKVGNIQWKTRYGSTKSDKINKIVASKNGEFYIVGETYAKEIGGNPNNGDSDALILKYNSEGHLLWDKNFGGASQEYFTTAEAMSDGSLFAVVVTNSSEINGDLLKGETDSILVKYDNDGNLVYFERFGGNQMDRISSISLIDDEKMYIMGPSYSTDLEGLINKGYSDIIVAKYSTLYEIEVVETPPVEGEEEPQANGEVQIETKDNKGVITPLANEGYKVSRIIVRDKTGLEIPVTYNENGTYEFTLQTDATVEVIFEKILENPKTGIVDVLVIIFIGLIVSLSGFILVKRYNERLEF